MIGLSSTFKSKPTAGDYYLASRSVSPIFVGLSAMSTNNSGYMFVGFMGYSYIVGLDAVWLLFGWILGDFTTSLFVHRKLRDISEAHGALTFAQALSRWGGENFQLIRVVVAIISLVFLSIYSAGQLNAGGKSLEALFGLSTVWGALLVAVMVAFYCIFGGIRASLWTDVAQTLVMLLAMAVLAFACLANSGGISGSYAALSAIPDRLNLLPSGSLLFGDSTLAIATFIFSWIISGFCAAGQPQIMVRFMTMQNSMQLNNVRAWYYGVYILFGFFAMVVGLMTKVYFPSLNGMDAEFILPTMADRLLPDIMVGLMLAGIFAAIMSTADSLLLSCSSALTHDIMPEKFETPFEMKFATLGITLFAFGVAWYAIAYGGQNVFRLTQFAWAGMGAAFGPLLLLLGLRQTITPKLALTMIVTGLTSVVVWSQLGLAAANEVGVVTFSEGIAGVGASFLVWGLWKVAFSYKRVSSQVN